MEYGYQGLDTGLKVWYLLNGIRSDKLSTAVIAVKVHPDKYEKDFNTVVTFLTQYINKRELTPSVKIVFVNQNRPTKQQKNSTTCETFKGKIELKKYSREEYDSMLVAQHQQLYELWKKARLIKGKKTPESSSALEARVAALEAKTENSSNESLFTDVGKPKPNNRYYPILDRKGSGTRQSHADT